jgi:predicted ATPase
MEQIMKPHEIIHKKTGRVVGTYASYEEAMAAYEKLGWEMTDHAIGPVMEKGTA